MTETAESCGTREPRDDNQSPATDRKTPRFVETLKEQFRELAKVLTHNALAPHPAQRRRRTEETGRAFRMTAGKIMGRAVRLPAAAYAAVAFLSDTLDWLNPWQGHDTANTDNIDDDFHQTQQYDISHHHL